MSELENINRRRNLWRTLTALLLMGSVHGIVQAQAPPAIEAELRKMGQGVFPACTAKLYRTLMPVNDYNTYWAPDAAAPNAKIKLYPGVALSRDVQFGPDPKDLIDVFVGDKGPSSNRTVLIYIPGGGGNKIEQQAPESNAFYDNIGRWATENNMVGVTMQRHGGNPAGQDVAARRRTSLHARKWAVWAVLWAQSAVPAVRSPIRAMMPRLSVIQESNGTANSGWEHCPRRPPRAPGPGEAAQAQGRPADAAAVPELDRQPARLPRRRSRPKMDSERLAQPS